MTPRFVLSRRRLLTAGLASATAPIVARVFGISAQAQDFGPAGGKLGVVGGRDEKVLFPGPGLPGGGQTEIRMVQSIYTSDPDELDVAQRLKPFDPESWLNEWARVAERNEQFAEGYAAAGLKVTAQEYYRRAQEFYSNATLYLPEHHPRQLPTYKKMREMFDKAWQMGLNKQTAAKSQAAVSKAEVEKARAALERYQTDLRYATITSPMDGLVLSRDVEVGDAVSSILVLGSQATLVMTLGDVSEVYVLGKVDEADIGRVYMGQRARIVVESFKEKSFEGKVTKISPLGKEKDNVTTFEVRVSIRNPGGELKTNMTANAEIILEEKKAVLIVPESAVVYDKERKPSLEVPDPKAEGGKRKVAVKLGISNGVKTELVEGLKEGDKVVLQ